MANTSTNNQRIAKNTILLYFRMILLMAVTLYTSRVVLATLGIEDYGIYNVVGGFIGMLAFLNGAMCGCTQRFITIALGKGNEKKLKQVFSTSVLAHSLIALIVFILAETIGLWFLLEKLVIPEERMTAAIVVYQCSVASTLVYIMSFPYNADIIAHERMSVFAFISIFEAFANLGIVYLLQLGNIDKLILYAVLFLAVKIIVIIIYRIYCRWHFKETIFRWYFDKKLFREMLSFTGWNLFGGVAGTLMGTGLNVLLNVFFGAAINAARGVAVQVQGAVQLFASNFQVAINPQIMKTYAANNLNEMHYLIFRSAKYSFMLLLCLVLPIFLEIDTLMAIWLKEVPDYTNTFVRLMLCISVIDAVSNPFMTAAAATGKVRVYQSVVGSILLIILPLSYIALLMDGEPQIVFIVHLLVALIAFVVRLLIIKRMIKLSIRTYFSNVVSPCILVTISAISLSILFKMLMPNGFLYAVAVIMFAMLSVIVSTLFWGMTANERMFVLSKVFIRKKA